MRPGCLHLAGLAITMVSYATVYAGEWDITPRVTLGETFTDNVNLEPSGEEDAGLITEVTPGIHVKGKSARLIANIDYQLQALFYLGDGGNDVGSNHQLFADITGEVVNDLFFVDASGRIFQTTIDTERRGGGSDLVSGTGAGNRTNVYGYSISPYLRNNFGGYVNGLARYTHSRTFIDDGASGSTSNAFSLNLSSGRNFRQLSWFGNLLHRKQERNSSAGDVTFKRADGEARYRLSSTFSLVGQAGWRDDDFRTSRNDLNNGSYWAVGGNWQPSRFFFIGATKGNNLATASFGLFPTRRTSLLVNWQDLEVGSNPGETWTGSFSHRSRRTTWGASYTERTTTTQDQLLESSTRNVFIDPETGEVVDNPQPGDNVVIQPVEDFTLTDEVFVRKRATGTVGMKTGKSGLRLTVYNERREYEESRTEETTNGVTSSWNYRLAPRTNSILTASWRGTERDESTDNDRWFVQFDLVRRIRPDLLGSINFRHTQQDSNESRNNYAENRIFARITAFF